MKIFSESLYIKVKPEKAFWNNITNFKINPRKHFNNISLRETRNIVALEKSDLFNKQHLILKFYSAKSEYISPLTLYDITGFTQEFLKAAYKKKNYDHFFLKYSSNAKKVFEKNFSKKQHYFISTIRSESNTYEVTLINEEKLFQYFFFKFLGKFAIHKVRIQKVDDEFKIIHID